MLGHPDAAGATVFVLGDAGRVFGGAGIVGAMGERRYAVKKFRARDKCRYQ